MSDNVRTYSPDMVIVTIGGYTIEGFADGSFITVSQVTDGISDQSGADGEIARAMSTDNRYNFNVTLQQTSASNDVLSLLHNVDRRSRGAGMVPVGMVDLSGRSLFAASQGWIIKLPDITMSKGIETRAWNLRTGRPSIVTVGGNS